MFEDNIWLDSFRDEGDFIPLLSVEEDEEGISELFPDVLPILVLKNTVLLPGIVIPITAGRQKSIEAIYKANAEDKLIGILSQKDVEIEDPVLDDLYTVGTVARILKMIKMPDGSITVIIQGKKKFSLKKMIKTTPYFEGEIEIIEPVFPENELEFEALMSSVQDAAKKIIKLSPNIPTEANIMLQNISSKKFLLNFIASNLNVKTVVKQKIHEENNLMEKGKMILQHMDSELQLLEIKGQIESKVKGDIEKQQRDYFLSQQLKTIQKELGQSPHEEELKELAEKAKKKKWSEEINKVFFKELNKAKRTNPQVAEYSVLLNYLELFLELPWNEYTKDNFDLKKVQKVLDQDHYGLEKVKKRILEHLAVLKLKGDMKAPILCLVGPPGVGKTSLGKSIARSINRRFVRMSLGGLHDESEIRGHRKTYIGAMPGRIIQSLKKVKSSNPVFILDEIDKVGKDFRGDPSSALLEVLDPEQNSTFHDNYLDVEYDLSKILFVATANNYSKIQPALRDRMETIFIEGYSTEEKIEIAMRHLVKKQRGEHGLKANQVKITKRLLKEIITKYTKEAGVRNLDRKIAALMRSVAKKVAMDEPYNVTLKSEDLKDILGPQIFTARTYVKEKIPGVAVGLAWTTVGGVILFVEVSISKGKGKLTLTGNLGSVMKESAITAMSFLKANAKRYGLKPKCFEEYDVHIHVPAGATKKDGPSAGITMLTALLSAFLKKPIKPYLAMTGEITLRGKVLPVGGIKDKILAAKRAGVKELILCKDNERHIEEINDDFIKGLTFHYVTKMNEVLQIALDLK